MATAKSNQWRWNDPERSICNIQDGAKKLVPISSTISQLDPLWYQQYHKCWWFKSLKEAGEHPVILPRKSAVSDQ